MPESASPGMTARRGARGWLAVLLAAFLLWMLNHPMLSIDNHDARIYSILALHWLTPEAYARDPFFMFGSQDSYSLFSPLYGLLIRELGLTVAASTVMLVGGVLWCVAAMAVASGLGLSRWIGVMAVLAAAVLSINYSPNGQTFLLNEGFATARSIAFPLGALALAACLHERLWLAGLLAIAALLVHPLIGIWALAVALLWRLSARQIAVLLVTAILLLLGLMFSEVGPFVRFDAEWEHILRTHTWDVFVAEPAGMRWRDYMLMLLALLATALHVRENSAARMYRRALLVSAVALLSAMFASLVWPSKIVIQAQLWRGMWLAAYLLPFALCHLLMLSLATLRPAKGGWPWASMALLAVLFMLRDAFVYVLMALSLIALLRRCCATERVHALEERLRDIVATRWMPLLSVGLCVMAVPNLWAELTLLGGAIPVVSPVPPQFIGLVFYGGAGVGFALLAWALGRYGQRPIVVCGLLLALVFASVHWDRRNERDRQWEAYAAFGRSDVMTELIKPGEVVLWDERLPLNAWYELRTAHYASPTQAIGIVFSREKTFELLARVRRIREAYAQERGLSEASQTELHAFAFSAPSGSGIPLLCRDPGLDWVVAIGSGAAAPPGGIAVPYPSRGPGAMLHLFRCAELRGQLGAP